jgi:hypothetical protein
MRAWRPCPSPARPPDRTPGIHGRGSDGARTRDELVDQDSGRDERQLVHTDVVCPVFCQPAHDPSPVSLLPPGQRPRASASHGAGRARRRVIVLVLEADTDDTPVLPLWGLPVEPLPRLTWVRTPPAFAVNPGFATEAKRRGRRAGPGRRRDPARGRWDRTTWVWVGHFASRSQSDPPHATDPRHDRPARPRPAAHGSPVIPTGRGILFPFPSASRAPLRGVATRSLRDP